MAFDGTLKFDTEIVTEGFKSGLEKIGSFAKKGMALVAGAVTAASGAMVALGKSALDAYADYEQLTGGVSTLFGTQDRSLEEYAASVGKSVDEARGEYDKLLQAQTDVMDNAAKAFRTAGLSQNEYMETVTSFSAALIASLGGDTLKAAEVADKAIIDMADNANKMGSSMESIQNAYQGFAKQNYTMLDNLKLGYGGTKSEMERLLADAEAISGVHYDIESYADVVEAIHVIQDEMGITGTTAKEAAETISGSVASMKSAWSDLVVGIADDEQDFDKLTNDFVESAATAAENILPRVETILGGMGKLVTSMSGVIADTLVGFTEYIPDLTEAGVSLVDALVQGMVDNAPALAMAAADVIQALVDTIADSLPELIQAVLDIIVSLAKAIVAAAPTICKALIDLIPILINTIISSIPQILDCITDIFNAIVEALPDLIVVLVENLPTIIVAIVETLIEAIPQILEAAVQMFMAIVDALPEILVALVTGLGELLGKIGEFLKNIIVSIVQWAIEMREKARQAAKDFLDGVVEFFKEIPHKIGEFIGQAIGNIVKWALEMREKARQTAKDFLDNVVTFFKELPGKIWDNLTAAIKHVISWGLELSKNMVEGLWNGIKNMGQWIKDKIFGFADGIIFLCL